MYVYVRKEERNIHESKSIEASNNFTTILRTSSLKYLIIRIRNISVLIWRF